LLEFAHALAQRPLAPHLAAQARRCLLDNLGCGLFGASQPWTRIMRAEIEAEQPLGTCSVFGSERTAAAPAAALVNGTAIHGFELDDLIPAAIVHPGTVVVPAALAAAESAGASGSQLLAAIVAGYEVIARVSLALGAEPSQRGFHKTSVAGPVAAAVAASIALRSSVDETECAVGLACSMASGIKAYAAGGAGGMVKRMHAGRAAEAGVRAAQLARRGFTGPANALDGRLGLLEVFSGAAARPEALVQDLRERWFIDDVWVKVYPLCGWIQGVAQLLLQLRGEGPLRAQDVKRIRVGTSAFAVAHNGNPAPADEMEAQYSIPYCAALAATADPADPAAFGLAAISAPELRELARRVELGVDAECDAVYPQRFGTRVELELANGERRQGATLDPHGTAADPLTGAELERKFARLALQSPQPLDAAAIAAAVRECDRAADVRALTRHLRPAGSSPQ
jgi:2-methylcitrate dehydratase PrpD